jgi:hypothetical protein
MMTAAVWYAISEPKVAWQYRLSSRPITAPMLAERLMAASQSAGIVLTLLALAMPNRSMKAL